MADEFSRFHPIVNILFFFSVPVLAMLRMQAGLTVISLGSAAIYYFYLKGTSGLKYFGVILVMFLLTVMINPLFSHKGADLLFYLPTGNPVTKESVLYGIFMGIMLCGTLLCFSCMNLVVTQDQWIEFAGRWIPHFALLLSMIFSFIPKYTRQIQKIHLAGKAVNGEPLGKKAKLKNAFLTFSIATTCALENSVDTVNSMRARGYGSGKRTTFHRYRITVRDGITIAWILCCGILVVTGLVGGRTGTLYYPYYVVWGDAVTYSAYFLLCMTPLGINGREALRWRRLKFKI